MAGAEAPGTARGHWVTFPSNSLKNLAMLSKLFFFYVWKSGKKNFVFRRYLEVWGVLVAKIETVAPRPAGISLFFEIGAVLTRFVAKIDFFACLEVDLFSISFLNIKNTRATAPPTF